MTNEFYALMRGQPIGKPVVYYRGKYVASLGRDKRIPIAQAAWEAYERGDVLLTQRRCGDEFEYLATWCA